MKIDCFLGSRVLGAFLQIKSRLRFFDSTSWPLVLSVPRSIAEGNVSKDWPLGQRRKELECLFLAPVFALLRPFDKLRANGRVGKHFLTFCLTFLCITGVHAADTTRVIDATISTTPAELAADVTVTTTNPVEELLQNVLFYELLCSAQGGFDQILIQSFVETMSHVAALYQELVAENQKNPSAQLQEKITTLEQLIVQLNLTFDSVDQMFRAESSQNPDLTQQISTQITNAVQQAQALLTQVESTASSKWQSFKKVLPYIITAAVAVGVAVLGYYYGQKIYNYFCGTDAKTQATIDSVHKEGVQLQKDVNTVVEAIKPIKEDNDKLKQGVATGLAAVEKMQGEIHAAADLSGEMVKLAETDVQLEDRVGKLEGHAATTDKAIGGLSDQVVRVAKMAEGVAKQNSDVVGALKGEQDRVEALEGKVAEQEGGVTVLNEKLIALAGRVDATEDGIGQVVGLIKETNGATAGALDGMLKRVNDGRKQYQQLMAKSDSGGGCCGRRKKSHEKSAKKPSGKGAKTVTDISRTSRARNFSASDGPTGGASGIRADIDKVKLLEQQAAELFEEAGKRHRLKEKQCLAQDPGQDRTLILPPPSIWPRARRVLADARVRADEMKKEPVARQTPKEVTTISDDGSVIEHKAKKEQPNDVAKPKARPLPSVPGQQLNSSKSHGGAAAKPLEGKKKYTVDDEWSSTSSEW